MALFVQTPCKFEGDVLVDQVVWSTCDTIAALSASHIDDNEVQTFKIFISNNEGGLLANSVISHHHQAKVLAWQPQGKLLAIGWADDGRSRPSSTTSNTSQHNSEVTMLRWNPSGKRLITGDKDGIVNVWVVDARGTLTPSRQYRKRGTITCSIYCLITPKLESFRKIDWKKNYSPPFFFGTDRGIIVYADDLGHCTEVQQLSSTIDQMLFYEEKSRLIIITRSLLLTQYQVADDGRVSRTMQVKLSVAKEVADLGIQSVAWAGPGLLAMATHEKMVRLLDVSTDESYNLSLSSIASIDKSDRAVVVSFNPVNRYLAVGTQMGTLAIWKYFPRIRRDEAGNVVNTVASTDWELHFSASVGAPTRNIAWSPKLNGTATVVTERQTVFMSETIMWHASCGELTVVQVSTTEVSVHCNLRDAWVEDVKLIVRGLAVSNSSFAVWSGKNLRVSRVDQSLGRVAMLEPFACNSHSVAISDTKYMTEDSLFIADDGIVKITNYMGTQKASISFTEAEGVPTHVDINGKYLYVMTSNFYIKIFDVNKPTSPKPVGSAFRFRDTRAQLSTSIVGQAAAQAVDIEVRQIRGNFTGTRLAVLTNTVEGALRVSNPETTLHIYDRGKGSVLTHSFSATQRYPSTAYWDNFDDRLLVCEAVKIPAGAETPPPVGALPVDKQINRAGSNEVEGENIYEIVLFFVSSEHGILLQDSFPRISPYGELVGVNVPHILFRNVLSPSNASAEYSLSKSSLLMSNYQPVRIYVKVMRDFVGLTRIDDDTKVALLEFSYNLTLGKLDEAYRAVKAIDSPAIWENMAQMCVKTKRLDVAEVCLGNMGHARGAAALRESLKENSSEVSIGVLAIQLGLLDDAARMFREAKRFDLLCDLYQSAGQWEKAIITAKTADRIHLRRTHFHYAQHLESIGDVATAMKHYESSLTFRTEVPRMLYSLGQIDELEDYVNQSDDHTLLKWWAAYLESKERYDKAKRYYAKSGDFLSLVRILCFQGEFDRAADIVHESGDSAAAYHFARQLEARGDLQDAIGFYASSGCFNHAIRLAKAYSMDTDLMRFAIKSTPSLMLDCAAYFEGKGDLEKAVQLYHKGGDYPRAMDLCFRAGGSQTSYMFDMLNTIAQDLGAETSPQTLARCAEFLVMHKQFDKAVELYIMAKRYHQAIEMCFQQRVNISDEMVEVLTPDRSMEANERKEILKDLGRALKKEGSYALASKKYTEAGEYVRAMKCLIRGGDTKAVIQFASISRKAEVYKLAANYLQQMNWRDAEIMKAIISFYSRAKAFEQLAGFYDSCAQVEIDEYRDYEKAYKALRESLKYLMEAKGNHIEEMVSALEVRLSIIEKFIEAKKNPKRMVEICEDLLNEPQLDMAIRVGDCLAMLVEYFYDMRDMKRAYHYMLEMKDRRILLHPYIDADILDAVHRAVGVPLDMEGDEVADEDGGEEDEVVDEELEEDIEEEEEVRKPAIRRPDIAQMASNRNYGRK